MMQEDDILGLTLDDSDARFEDEDDEDSYKYEENEDETNLMAAESAILAYCNETALANDLIVNIEKSRNFKLLGLEFVMEIRKGSDKSFGECKYWCALCQKSLVAYSLVSHLSTAQHQLSYLEKIFPAVHSHVKNNSNTSAVLKEYNKQIWDAVGPTLMIVVPDVEEATVLELLKKKLEYAQYLSYYNDVELEDEMEVFVVKERVKEEEDERSAKRQKTSSDVEIIDVKPSVSAFNTKSAHEYIVNGSSSPLKVLMVGGFFDHSDLSLETLQVSKITYAPHDRKLLDHDDDGLLFMETIKRYRLSDYDIMTITPFNWLTTNDSLEALGINIKASGVRGVEKDRGELWSKVDKLLKSIKLLSRDWERQFPKLSVIWLLPYPFDFSKRKMPARATPKHIAYRSIIQLSAILFLTIKWIKKMPRSAVVSLYEFFIPKSSMNSFFDGNCNLAWDTKETVGTFGSGISKGIRRKMWLKIMKNHLFLKSDAKRIERNNENTMKELEMRGPVEDYKQSLSSSNFIKSKAYEWKVESINPDLYRGYLEWSYYLNNMPREERMSKDYEPVGDKEWENKNDRPRSEGWREKRANERDELANNSPGRPYRGPLKDFESDQDYPRNSPDVQDFSGSTQGYSQNGPNQGSSQNFPVQDFTARPDSGYGQNGPVGNFTGDNGPNQNYLQGSNKNYTQVLNAPTEQYKQGTGAQGQQYPYGYNAQGQQYPQGHNTQDQQFSQGPNAPGQQYPQGPNAPGQQYTQGPNAPGQQYPQVPNDPGQQYPQVTNAPSQQYPQVANAPGQQYPQVINAPGQQYPQGTNALGQQYPQVSNAPGQQYPQGTNTLGQQYPQVSNAPGQQYPQVTNAPGQQYPQGTNAPSQQYLQVANAPGQQYPQGAHASNYSYIDPNNPAQCSNAQNSQFPVPEKNNPQAYPQTVPAQAYPQSVPSRAYPQSTPGQAYPQSNPSQTYSQQGQMVVDPPSSGQTASFSNQPSDLNSRNSVSDRLGGYLEAANTNPPKPKNNLQRPAPVPVSAAPALSELPISNYSPMCSLNILCEAKSLLGFLGGPLLSLQQEAIELESQKKDSMTLFGKSDPVELIKLCLGKLDKLKPEDVKDSDDQFMIDPARKLCKSLIEEIYKRF